MIKKFRYVIKYDMIYLKKVIIWNYGTYMIEIEIS